MTLDDAVQQMMDKIETAHAGMEIEAVKMSEEEAPPLKG
jgi:hypothetical protein